MDEQDVYVAVTGDLVGSGRLSREKRSMVQERLVAALEACNGRFGDEVAVGFSVTGGDEFQGLLTDLARTVDVVDFVRRELYPQQVRFGIGVGELSTGVAERTSLMDGECFRRSRAALAEAREKEVPVRYETGDEFLDTAVNAIWQLVAAIQEGWKALHHRRFWLYKELGELKRVAAEEGTSVGAIGKSLKRAGYRSILQAENDLRELLLTQGRRIGDVQPIRAERP